MNNETVTTEPSSRLRVLVTGAGGYIAKQLVPHLADRFELRILDVVDVGGRYGITDTWVADLTDLDRTHYQDAFVGIDVVVHLGYVRSSPADVYDPTVEHLERFETEQKNVSMAYNVYRCALEAGVRRVVVASSNHAADWYEHALVHEGRMDMITVRDLPLSDNFYGWSKAAYELLSFPFACGTFGRKLEMVHIRIGAPREVDAADHIGRELPSAPGPQVPAGAAGLKRDLGAYMSEEDGRQLFTLAIEVDNISNAYGIPWLVVYGISGNTRAFWSIDTARDVLGYQPVDNSEERFADQVRQWLPEPDPRHDEGDAT